MPPGRSKAESKYVETASLLDSEAQVTMLYLDLHALHIVNDEVGTAVLNLRPLVAGADSDDDRARRDASPDTRGRILENDTACGIKAELLGSEQERVRRGLARLETLVVRGDGDARRDDADAGHTSVCYGQAALSAFEVQKETGATYRKSLPQRLRRHSVPQGGYP